MFLPKEVSNVPRLMPGGYASYLFRWGAWVPAPFILTAWYDSWTQGAKVLTSHVGPTIDYAQNFQFNSNKNDKNLLKWVGQN